MAGKTSIGTAWVTVKPSMDGVANAIDRGFNKVAGQITKSNILGSAIGSLISNAASSAVSKVSSVVTSTIQNAVDTMDSQIRASNALNALGYDSNAVSGKLSQLRENAVKTAASFGDLSDGFLALTASWKDIDVTADATQALSDAILSFGGTPDQVANAITQISQVDLDGPLDAQTWLSLRNSGLIPVLGTLARLKGMSLGDYKEWLSAKGNGTTRDFINGLIELDQKGTETQSALEDMARSNAAATWSGTWNTAAEGISAAMADSLTKAWQSSGLGEKILSIADKIGAAMPNLINKIILIGEEIWSFTKRIYNLAGGTEILKGLWDALKGALSAIKPILKTVANYIGRAGAAIAKLGLKVVTNLLKVVTPILEKHGDVIASLAVTILSAKAAYAGVKGAISAFGSISKTLSPILNTVSLAMGAQKTAALALVTGNTQVAAGLTNVAAQSSVAQSGIMKVVSAIGGFGPAALLIGSATLAVQSFNALLIANETAAIRAETAERLRGNTVRMSQSATDALNRSTKRTVELLDEVHSAATAQNSAEAQMLRSRKAVEDAEKNYQSIANNSKSSTDDIRLAELDLSLARDQYAEDEKAFAAAKEESARKNDEYNNSASASLGILMEQQLAADATKGNYQKIAEFLERATDAEYTYRDATGKTAKLSKDDVSSMVGHVQDMLAQNDKTWASIVASSEKNGTTLMEEAKKVAPLTGETYSKGVSEKIPLIKDATKAAEKATEFNADDLKGKSWKSGKHVAEGFAKGISDNSGLAKNAADRLANESITAMKKRMDIHSPSRVFAEFGKFTVEGFAQGITENTKLAVSAIERMGEQAIDSMVYSPAHSNGFGLNSYAMSTSDTRARVVQYNNITIADGFDLKKASNDLGYAVSMA